MADFILTQSIINEAGETRELNRLTESALTSLIQSQDVSQFKINRKYYAGDNIEIQVITEAKTSTPNNFIPLPFGRKITNDAVGYVARPGKITYEFDIEGDQKGNDTSVKTTQEIFSTNDINLVTTEIVMDAFICGQGAELAWFDGDIPRFKQVDREMCAFVYKNDITETLQYSVRFYKVRGYTQGEPEYTYFAEVYWDSHIDYYEGIEDEIKTVVDPQKNKDQAIRNQQTIQYNYKRTEEHGFKDVPLYPYKINSDNKGIFQTLIPIINRLDFSGSDSIANAIDQFKDAILAFTKKVDPETAKKIRELRIVDELGTEGDYVKFIQRELDIDSSIKSFELFERLLYDLSPIVNFSDKNLFSQSGIAILLALIPMENEMSVAESYFSQGLQYRLQLINTVMSDTSGFKEVSATLKWERNIPLDMKTSMEIIKAAVETGKLSDETILKMFPADIVENAKDEMTRKAKEDQIKADAFMLSEDTSTDDDDVDDDGGNNE